MKVVFLLGVHAAVAAIACSGSPPGPATACAQVVGVYRGIHNPVAVVGQPVQTSEGIVEIRYESTDGMNLPVEGRAACTFTVGGAGALELIGAQVDGQLLPTDELTAIRDRLRERT